MPEDRPLIAVTRSARLPVWPVASGVLCWASELVGLPGVARAVERRWGGRVTPMSLTGSDPFLMLVHHRHSFSRLDPLRPLSALLMPEGFPAHPHRGFETVTFVLEGGMRHRDSVGTKMIYRAGSVQWLTAGRGVLHEEMWAHEPGNDQHELYQIWVNLPREHKLDDPAIQLLGPADVQAGHQIMRAELPKAEIDGVRLSVLGGSCRGVSSAVRTRSPMALVRLEWPSPGEFVWDDVPASHTALFFVRSGSVLVSGREVHAGELAQFERSPGALRFAALVPDTDVLVLTGAPIGEPVASGGSMVMNTKGEVDQAYRDLEAGAFGRSWAHTATDEEWLATVGR